MGIMPEHSTNLQAADTKLRIQQPFICSYFKNTPHCCPHCHCCGCPAYCGGGHGSLVMISAQYQGPERERKLCMCVRVFLCVCEGKGECASPQVGVALQTSAKREGCQMHSDPHGMYCNSRNGVVQCFPSK
eukprot:scaffold272444_cov18-Tisochrysis_lutea.AAC.1